MRKLLLASVLACGLQATTRTVCASGCDYLNTQSELQDAFNDAVAGDIIEINAGESVPISSGVGIVLPNKSLTDGPYITIRSSKCGNLAGGTRVTPSDVANLAKLHGSSPATSLINNAAGASHYRFHCIEFTGDSGFPGGSRALIQFGRDSGNGGVLDNQLSELAHDIIFDQCYIHGHTGASSNAVRRGIAANMGKLTVVNSWISDIKKLSTDGIESNAIGCWVCTGPFYFRNNHLDAAGIVTIFGGSTPNIMGIRVDGAWFIGNHYSKPWSWRVRSIPGDPTGTCMWDSRGGEYRKNTTVNTYWRCDSGTWTSITAGEFPPAMYVKNIFELKNATRVWVEGNYLENAWQPAFQGQVGAMFLFNLSDNDGAEREAAATISHVSVKNNFGRRSPWVTAFGIQGGPYFQWQNNIKIENNLFDEIGEPPFTLDDGEPDIDKRGGGFMWFTTGGPGGGRITYTGNTVINSTAGIKTGSSYVSSTTYDGCFHHANVTNNIIPWGTRGFFNDDGPGSGWYTVNLGICTADRAFSRNVVVNNKSLISSYGGRPWPIINMAWDVDAGSATGMACTASTPEITASPGMGGWCAFPQAWSGGSDNVGMINYPTNLRLDPTSRYKRWGHMAKDPGANIDEVLNSTSTTVAGTDNPFWDFQVKNVRPASTSIAFDYLAYSTAACTLTVSRRSDYSSPTTVTDSGGELNRTSTATSLDINMRYYWKVACATTYVREGVTRTLP